MKIIGGQFKGRNIYMPEGIRPTQNLTRKAVFDILGQDLEGASFLDLFAGSGAMGLEAVSRGSKNVMFVEHNREAFRVITQNIELLRLPMMARDGLNYDAIEADAFTMVKRLAEKNKVFDVVFVDPPYGENLAKKALNVLSRYVIVAATSWVIIEHNNQEHLPHQEGRFMLVKQKTYGKTSVSFYQMS